MENILIHGEKSIYILLKFTYAVRTWRPFFIQKKISDHTKHTHTHTDGL